MHPCSAVPTRIGLTVLVALAAQGGDAQIAQFAERPYAPASDLPPDMRVVRERWLDLMTLRAADPELDCIREQAESLTEGTRGLMERQILDEGHAHSGSWGQVSGLQDDAISYHAGYYSSPHRLAQAYACPHGELHRDAELLASLNAALTYGATYFHVGMERPNNWWAWDIGAPRRLGPTLLLAGDDIDPKLRDGYISALYHEGNEPRSLGFAKPGTGANAIWIAGNALRLALLTGDEPLMARASAIFADIARVRGEKGDGIMPDGSFHQHGNAINFGYGAAMLVDVAEYMYLTADTPFALPEASIDAQTSFFADYAVWDSYKGKYNPYSSGRAATRPGGFGSSAPARAAVYLLDAGIPEARQAALATLRDYTDGDAAAALAIVPALAARLEPHLADMERSGVVTGVRALPYSDMLISRSAEHFIAVRFAGSDTKGWFSIANENLRAHQAGEGSVVLIADGRELEQDTSINQPWDGLMGVTHCGALRRPREKQTESVLVGCASTANAGAIAGEYVITGDAGELRAKKSYLVFGNLLVMLAADVRSTLEETVATTLYSYPVLDDAPAPAVEAPWLLSPGQGVFYRTCGMALLEGEATVDLHTLSTPYKAVNARVGTDDVFENTYLRVFTSSEPGETGSYQALVAVGMAQDEHEAMLAAGPIVVAENTADLQAAMRTDGAAGIVVAHTAGECAAGGLSAAGVLLWERSGEQVELVVARHNTDAETIRVTVPLRLTAPSAGRIVAEGEGTTTIEIDVPGGYIVERRQTARGDPND